MPDDTEIRSIQLLNLMKLLTRGFILLIPVFFLSDTKCVQDSRLAKAQAIILTDNDSGKVLSISKGGVFALTLPDHIDGGYRFDKAQYDTLSIRLDNYTQKPPPPNSPPGRSGLAVWQFTTIKSGKSNLKITATRPWNGGGTITLFENTIVVK